MQRSFSFILNLSPWLLLFGQSYVTCHEQNFKIYGKFYIYWFNLQLQVALVLWEYSFSLSIQVEFTCSRGLGSIRHTHVNEFIEVVVTCREHLVSSLQRVCVRQVGKGALSSTTLPLWTLNGLMRGDGLRLVASVRQIDSTYITRWIRELDTVGVARAIKSMSSETFWNIHKLLSFSVLKWS